MLLRNELSAASVAEAAGGVAVVLCAVVASLDLAASTCTANLKSQAALMHRQLEPGPALDWRKEPPVTCLLDFAGQAFAHGESCEGRKMIMTAAASC